MHRSEKLDKSKVEDVTGWQMSLALVIGKKVLAKTRAQTKVGCPLTNQPI